MSHIHIHFHRPVRDRKVKDAQPRPDTERLPDGRYNNRSLGTQNMISWRPRKGAYIDYYDRQGNKRSGEVVDVSGDIVSIKDENTGAIVKQTVVSER